MNCMKCGRETLAEQVFCEECLLEMEKYPVRPGTVVQLPTRKESASPKKVSKRKAVSLEEQVRALKKRTRVLAICLTAAVALAAALAYPAVKYLLEDHFKIGQNYSSIVTSKPTEITSPTE